MAKIELKELRRNFKVNEIRNNIFHLNIPNIYILCSTFFRLQEFYESPYKEIRNKYFSLEKAMDVYSLNNNNEFTYFQDWCGFNIPDNVVKKFFQLFNSPFRPLLKKEKVLYESILKCIIRNPNPSYLIATCGHTDEMHEISHGYYYLYPEYKEKMLSLVDSYSHKKTMIRYLRKKGYTDNVFNDEIQAYLATSCPTELIDILELPKTWKYNEKFKEYFDEFDRKQKKLTKCEKQKSNK